MKHEGSKASEVDSATIFAVFIVILCSSAIHVHEGFAVG